MNNRNQAINKQMRDLDEFGVDNVVRLAPIRDGILPPNWLSTFEVGQSFISQGFNNVYLEEYTVMGKKQEITLLRENILRGYENQSTQSWVNNGEFSHHNKLKERL